MQNTATPFAVVGHGLHWPSGTYQPPDTDDNKETQ